MLAALAEADRVVLLGRPARAARGAPSERARSGPSRSCAALGEACAGKPVVIVPGNHDHELIAPALDDARLRSAGAAGRSRRSTTRPPAPLSRAVAERIDGAEVSLAYPGLWLRDDVYATHGHYLDVHLTVPRMECVFASAVGRAGGDPARGLRDARRLRGLAEPHLRARPEPRPARAGLGHAAAATSRARSTAARAARASPGARSAGWRSRPAVAALNAAGLGPFRSDISAVELRRAGLRAMGEVLHRLGIDAEHVIFGHTHRAGPLPGDVEGWTLPGGTRLHNTGQLAAGGRLPRRPQGPEQPLLPGLGDLRAGRGPAGDAQRARGPARTALADTRPLGLDSGVVDPRIACPSSRPRPRMRGDVRG